MNFARHLKNMLSMTPRKIPTKTIADCIDESMSFNHHSNLTPKERELANEFNNYEESLLAVFNSRRKER